MGGYRLTRGFEHSASLLFRLEALRVERDWKVWRWPVLQGYRGSTSSAPPYARFKMNDGIWFPLVRGHVVHTVTLFRRE